MSSPEHVVIIGNGVAGITAARHIRRISNKKITVISVSYTHLPSPRDRQKSRMPSSA